MSFVPTVESISTAFAFYLFSTITIAASGMVVVAHNAVYSVLFLILAFFSAAALFVIAGAEFLAMILVIVYVGAVAVLFLFVVMMFDVNRSRIKRGLSHYSLIGGLIGGGILIELLLIVSLRTSYPPPHLLMFSSESTNNTFEIGLSLYTDYVYLFQTAGLALLVAMIGAITLTLRTRSGVKRQNILHQVARDPTKTIELKNIPSGKRGA